MSVATGSATKSRIQAVRLLAAVLSYRQMSFHHRQRNLFAEGYEELPEPPPPRAASVAVRAQQGVLYLHHDSPITDYTRKRNLLAEDLVANAKLIRALANAFVYKERPTKKPYKKFSENRLQ